MITVKKKGEITAIGRVIRMPSDADYGWLLEGWAFRFGDFPGIHIPTGEVCGWTSAELKLIKDLADCAGYAAALNFAEEVRDVTTWEPGAFEPQSGAVLEFCPPPVGSEPPETDSS